MRNDYLDTVAPFDHGCCWHTTYVHTALLFVGLSDSYVVSPMLDSQLGIAVTGFHLIACAYQECIVRNCSFYYRWCLYYRELTELMLNFEVSRFYLGLHWLWIWVATPESFEFGCGLASSAWIHEWEACLHWDSHPRCDLEEGQTVCCLSPCLSVSDFNVTQGSAYVALSCCQFYEKSRVPCTAWPSMSKASVWLNSPQYLHYWPCSPGWIDCCTRGTMEALLSR